MVHTLSKRLLNLTQIRLSREQITMLNLGFDYAIEKTPKHFINALIVDTENTIRYTDVKYTTLSDI